jgi:CRP-like cAMP-binding protein
MIVVGNVAVVALRPHGRRAIVFPWCLLVAGSLVSVLTNSYSAVIAQAETAHALAAGLIAAVPPLVLLAMTHLTVELARRSRASRRDRAPEPAPVTGPPRQADGAPAANRLRELGLSNREIAEHLGIHPSTVGRWLADDARQRAVAAPTRPTGPDQEP